MPFACPDPPYERERKPLAGAERERTALPKMMPAGDSDGINKSKIVKPSDFTKSTGKCRKASKHLQKLTLPDSTVYRTWTEGWHTHTRNTFVLRFKQIQELIWRCKTAARLQQKSQFSTLQVGQSTSRPREGVNPKGRAG